jgi:hypothetical protein
MLNAEFIIHRSLLIIQRDRRQHLDGSILSPDIACFHSVGRTVAVIVI